MTNVVFTVILIHFASFFFISALLKLLSYYSFIQLIKDFKLLPSAFSFLIALTLPLIELGAALLLLTPSTILYGLLVIFFLLLSFLYAASKVRVRNERISCGCYGKLMDAQIDEFTLVKLAYFILLAFLALHLNLSAVKHYTFFSISLGLFITLLVMAMQKLWTTSSQAIRLLRKM